MKLITLNIWGGRVGDEAVDFFRQHADADIFLLQEVFHRGTEKTIWDKAITHPNLFEDIQELLPDHRGFFASSVLGEWGLASFIRSSLFVEEMGSAFFHLDHDSYVPPDAATIGRNLQYFQIAEGDRRYTVVNVHGLWNGKGKGDCDERLAQSRRIVEIVKPLGENIVMGGDFNLRPDTESVQILEHGLGLKNLITEYGVTNTRTSHYTKPERFADYIFVSPQFSVKRFSVLPDDVSDHAPLFVEV